MPARARNASSPAAAIAIRLSCRSAAGIERRLVQPYADGVAQAAAASGRDGYGAAVTFARDPAFVLAAATDFGADQAGDVVAPFAPVETGAAENAPRGGQGLQPRAE